MKRFKKIIIASSAIVMFVSVGCGQPSFNRSKKGIVFVEGKPYVVPYGTSYGPMIPEEKKLYLHYSKKMKKDGRVKESKIFKSMACPEGSIRWIETSIQNKIRKEKKKINGRDGMDTYIKMISLTYDGYESGYGGCAKQLNKQEYQYMLNQENQSAANARVRSQNNAVIDAALMPKTYNINHSGSIGVYKY